MTNRALITGIAGQDGSHIDGLLLDEDYEVFGLGISCHNEKRQVAHD